ncbi:MAG: FGGY-family carbohydrate kinase, partial [Ginsengibacter sp.]
SIKEFIWFRLFNVYEIDMSIASATGLFNIKNFEWNKPSLKFCGIKADKLSAIVQTNYSRNNIDASHAQLMQVPANTTFCIGASDGCLANIGSNAMENGIASLTIGTSGAVRIACSKPVNNFDAMIFNYVLDEETFISGGPINNGGSVIKWMFKTFLNKPDPTAKDYLTFFKTIDSISAGSEGLIFLPYLYGERAPVWDENAAGVFFGVKSYHTTGHFLHASVEGICYALNSILQIIETSTLPIKQLNVSGGFTNSPIWIKILANVTGKKIYLSGKEDASSIGAALLSMKSEKIIAHYPTSGNEDKDTIHPDKKAHAVYEKYFKVYKNLYEPTKNSMHELSKINRSL